MATDMGFVKVTLVGDSELIASVCEECRIDIGKFEIVDIKDELKAVAEAVRMVHDGEGDVLMKGLCSTDKFLRAILNKECGLLPAKGLLSHVGVIENPNYHKLMVASDCAIIPLPDLKQKQTLLKYVTDVAKNLGVSCPKVAMITATEQMSAGIPACVDAAIIAKMNERGQIKGCVVEGPISLDLATDAETAAIKGMKSPVAGDADCLVFPNLESSNVFYKCCTKFDKSEVGAMLMGAKVPCVLSSRGDTSKTKLYSIALAAMMAK
jgi:phosphate butyryltransferase